MIVDVERTQCFVQTEQSLPLIGFLYLNNYGTVPHVYLLKVKNEKELLSRMLILVRFLNRQR